MTRRGFCVVDALSSQTSGLSPCTRRSRTGKSLRTTFGSNIALRQRAHIGRRAVLPEGIVPRRLELRAKFRATGASDVSIDQNVDEIRRDVVEDPLIVRDQQN